MIYSRFQESLAEYSMVIEPDGDGENWSFFWYTDPISNGMSKWTQYNVQISDGHIALHGMTVPRSEGEMVEADRAMQFIKARYYERFGSDETDREYEG